jgi:hypothetical protein
VEGEVWILMLNSSAVLWFNGKRGKAEKKMGYKLRELMASPFLPLRKGGRGD